MTAATVAIIGAPLDLGAGRRGVDMGPSALRLADLHDRLRKLHYTVEDLGNIPVEQQEAVESGHAQAKYLDPIAASCTTLAQWVEAACEAGKFPLVLGGDHSVAIGTVSGISHHFRKAHKSIGLLWVDAHADMNTPRTSPSGNIHGMPLACLLGEGPSELTGIFGYSPKVAPRNVVIVGLRDVDAVERDLVRFSGLHYFTMRDIDEKGMSYVMKVALDLAGNGTDGVHLSFDMDSVDPDEAPGVGTPVRGGLSYREAHLAMEIACDSRRLCGLEIVEVNPVLDVANRTASLGVELVASALGKRIL